MPFFLLTFDCWSWGKKKLPGTVVRIPYWIVPVDYFSIGCKTSNDKFLTKNIISGMFLNIPFPGKNTPMYYVIDSSHSPTSLSFHSHTLKCVYQKSYSTTKLTDSWVTTWPDHFPSARYVHVIDQINWAWRSTLQWPSLIPFLPTICLFRFSSVHMIWASSKLATSLIIRIMLLFFIFSWKFPVSANGQSGKMEWILPGGYVWNWSDLIHDTNTLINMNNPGMKAQTLSCLFYPGVIFWILQELFTPWHTDATSHFVSKHF